MKQKQPVLEPQDLPTNAELRRLLEHAVTRLENWRLEVETNPNPRMVHVLKNVISHIESLTHITDTKISYSYKSLSRQMSVLVEGVAKLNIAITDSLMDDDWIDEKEEERINASLRLVFTSALDLIRIVQQAFTLSRKRLDVPKIEEVIP